MSQELYIVVGCVAAAWYLWLKIVRFCHNPRPIVGNSRELLEAVWEARAGDVIRLQAGTFQELLCEEFKLANGVRIVYG